MRIKQPVNKLVNFVKCRLWKRHKRKLVAIFVAIFLIALATLAIHLSVHDASKFTIYNSNSTTAIPAKPVAIIFGAAVDETTPRFELEKRLDSGLALYRQGKVPKLLMSGGANEVKVMELYAEQRGVPASAIVDDGAGLRTYDSCYRARHTFNFTQAIVVNQPEYLVRTLYLCNSLGLDAVGLQAPTKIYSTKDLSFRLVREYLASQRAWIDVNLTHPSA
jgi:SanA protein